MDSANESFTISSQETLILLHYDQQPSPSKQSRIKNLKIIIFLALLIIAGFMILSSICKKLRKPEQLNSYLSGSSRYYCHLTPYPELCYCSMSSIINTTVLNSNPGPIFSTSLQIAINELNNTTVSIAKALSSPTANNPLVGPRLSKCQTLVHDSLNRLNESLGLLGVDSDIESLTYMEMDIFRVWTMAATDNAGKCFLALEEIDDMMMVSGEDEKMGVEEVKLGVEKANKHIVNSIWLFDGKESIFFDFYNPFIDNDDYNYNHYFSYIFEYRFLVCFYSVMYLFLALLYFLFRKSN